MMTTLADVLNLLGRATWEPFWVPVLTWTALVLPLWLLLERTERLHPRAEYRLSQVLLAALPVGIGAAALLDLLPEATAVASTSAGALTILPSVDAVEATSSAPTWQWIHVVGLVTAGAALGALISLGRLVLDAVVARRAHDAPGERLPRPLHSLLERLRDRLEVRRPVRVRLTTRAKVPITLGGIHPTILLPHSLTDDREALQMSLVHEFVHLRRYDDWAQFLERLIGAVFVVHPLVGQLQCLISAARERACDAAVLDEKETSPASYARLLVAFVEERSSAGRLGALSLSESPPSLTTRLTAMRSTVSHWLSSPLALGSTLLVVGLALTLGVAACSDSVAPSSDTPDEEATTSSQSLQQLAGREDPLYVVDGEIQESVDDINPDDITSIEVLKDSAATDEYGERGANGVLLITTKQNLDSKASDSKIPEDEVYVVVEDNPDCGGVEALRKHVEYPELAQEAGIEGRVFVQFVVDENGSVQDPLVTRSVHETLDDAALNAVQQLECEPGTQRGTPVKVQMSLPVVFRLPD